MTFVILVRIFFSVPKSNSVRGIFTIFQYIFFSKSVKIARTEMTIRSQKKCEPKWNLGSYNFCKKQRNQVGLIKSNFYL